MTSNIFTGRLAVTPSEAAAAVFGWTPATTRTKMCRGDFPLPLISIGGRKLVRVNELIEFVASRQVILQSKPRPAGRPTKAMQIAKQGKAGAA